MPDLRNKDTNNRRHLQLHPLAAGSLAADPATGLWVQVAPAAWAIASSCARSRQRVVGGDGICRRCAATAANNDEDDAAIRDAVSVSFVRPSQTYDFQQFEIQRPLIYLDLLFEE